MYSGIRSLTLKLCGASMVAVMLNGCVAALLPIAAVGMMGKSQYDRTRAKREIVETGAVDVAQQVQLNAAAATATATATAEKDAFTGQGGLDEDTLTVDLSEDDRKYLSRFFKPLDASQPAPYAGFTSFALREAANIEAGQGALSAILKPKAMLEKDKRMSCAGKPPAVIIDLDSEDGTRWSRAQTLYRQNGLTEALAQLRAAKISIIWLSNEPAQDAARVAAILEEGGLSAPESDDFLLLDRGADDRKQERRWDAARNYCVLAVAGDERADFDELYEFLRTSDSAVELDHMFNRGWFVTPPPLVIANDIDDTDDAGNAADAEIGKKGNDQ